MLALGIVSLTFARNGQINRAAVHDLGLAAGNLLVEATARGLFVHQMLGILPDKARETFDIPEGFEAWTAIAIGYRGDPTSLPETLRERERMPRQRKPLSQFVFSGTVGESFAAHPEAVTPHPWRHPSEGAKFCDPARLRWISMRLRV